jgi:hypothetical protein
MFKPFALTALLLLTAPCTYAQDSAQTASNTAGDSVTANARLSEAGVKVVAGVAAVPMIVGGASLALPGAAIASTGNANNDSLLLSAGIVAATPGLAIMASGAALNAFANQPLQISSETVIAEPLKTLH